MHNSFKEHLVNFQEWCEKEYDIPALEDKNKRENPKIFGII